MKCLLPLILLFPTVCVGQDYQIARSDFVHFFQDEASSYRGMKIDSVESNGTDSILYNYLVLRSDDYFQSFEAYVPSWLGEKVVVKPSGDNLLFNSNGDTIVIKTQAQVLETWNFFQFDSSTFLEARVEGIGNETILDSLDQVKIIGLQAKDMQGQPVNHPMNGKIIAISKSLGIVLGYDFHLFPEDTTQIEIVGMENPDRGIYRLKWGEIYDFQFGDEFHYKREDDFPLIEKRIQIVTDVETSGNQRTVEFEIHKLDMWFNGNPGPTTQMFASSSYSLSEIYEDLDLRSSNFMPNEATMLDTLQQSGYGFFTHHSFFPHTSSRVSSLQENFYNPYIQDSVGFWSPQPSVSGSSHTNYFYANGIGRTYWRYYDYDGWWITDYSERMEYFKKGTEEWGNPYSLSAILNNLEVNVKASNIYPNPVRIGQSIQLGLGTIETFKLFSIDGKQVPIELGNGTMKTDNLVAGIYLIRVEAGTGVTNQKLVVTD